MLREIVNALHSFIVYTFVELVSGDLHRELKLNYAMPTVCRAMEKMMEYYPHSELFRPETVKKYSSTIKVRYRLK